MQAHSPIENAAKSVNVELCRQFYSYERHPQTTCSKTHKSRPASAQSICERFQRPGHPTICSTPGRLQVSKLLRCSPVSRIGSQTQLLPKVSSVPSNSDAGTAKFKPSQNQLVISNNKIKTKWILFKCIHTQFIAVI